MFVIHGMCDAEMRVVEEPVFQGYDFSAIGTPNASHYVKPRIDTVRWYECPDCKARIRASEIMDGIRFCNGGRVEINGKTFMTGMHRVTWHGGHDQVLLHNVNDGFSNRVDWSGAEPPASYIDDVYGSWDVERAARSFQIGRSISDAVREYQHAVSFAMDAYGISTLPWAAGE